MFHKKSCHDKKNPETAMDVKSKNTDKWIRIREINKKKW